MKFLIFIFIWLLSTTAFAQNGFAQDNDIELRAKSVGQSLRCVVCQNQSIEDSDAPLAADMRVLVRNRLKAGDSEAEVINYMQERYGDYVLLKPPVQSNTYALWFLPFAALAGGLAWFILSGKKDTAS